MKDKLLIQSFEAVRICWNHGPDSENNDPITSNVKSDSENAAAWSMIAAAMDRSGLPASTMPL